MQIQHVPVLRSGVNLQVDISGDSVVVTSGAVTVLSGLHVNISGAHLASLSGLHVQVSGQHVFIESGAHVVADVDVVVSSGLWIDGVSGVHVFVESGAYVVGNVIASGTVYVDNIPQGNPLWVTASGDHFFVESGSFVTASVLSGAGVQVQSGLYVIAETARKPTSFAVGDTVIVTSASGGDSLTSGVAKPVSKVFVKSVSGLMYLGTSGAGMRPYSGHGYLLDSVQGSYADKMEMLIGNAESIYLYAITSGMPASYIGIP